MMRPYQGDTPNKLISRHLVWSQHQRVLGEQAFKAEPHMFLASQYAGDVQHLRQMGVDNDNIWAVEMEESQYRPILDKGKLEHRLFCRPVECVVENKQLPLCRSIYLDFCGTLPGHIKPLRRVARQMSPGGALSVCALHGRERNGFRQVDREAWLYDLLREHCPHKVTLVQEVRYWSKSDTKAGAPMRVWTFSIGNAGVGRAKMRFDLGLCCETPAELLWQEALTRANNRSQAAVKANANRVHPV